MASNRVVFLSWYSHHQADSGERVRLAALIREISKEFQVRLISIEPERDFNPEVDYRIADGARIAYAVPRTMYLASTVHRRALEAHILASKKGLGAAIERGLRELSPDIIIANQPYVYPLIPKDFLPKTVVDTHNVNSSRLRRLATALPPWDPRRRLLHTQVSLTEKFESGYVNASAQVWAVTPTDAQQLSRSASSANRVALIENGADFPDLQVSRNPPDGPLQALFFASLSYFANIYALRTLSEWMKAIPDTFPVRVTVAGSGDTGSAENLCHGDHRLHFVGRVNSPTQLYAEHDCLLVPLKHGGGSRLKVIEAAANGIPLLSTAVGAEGTGLVGGVHYQKMENPTDLLRALKFLVEDAPGASAMAARATERSARFDWRDIGVRASVELQSLIADQKRS